MKKLIVSLKNSNQVFSEFKRALRTARKGKLRGDHFEVAFDDKRDFDRFVKNLNVLSMILVHRPKSIYELARLTEMDVSNLNKLVAFFERVGVIKVKTSQQAGRAIRTPIVEYQQVEFDLRSA